MRWFAKVREKPRLGRPKDNSAEHDEIEITELKYQSGMSRRKWVFSIGSLCLYREWLAPLNFLGYSWGGDRPPLFMDLMRGNDQTFGAAVMQGNTLCHKSSFIKAYSYPRGSVKVVVRTSI